MRRGLAILAAAATLAAGTARAAEPEGFAQFQSLCYAHRGHPEQSITAADAAGWMPAPRSMIPELPPPMTDGTMRLRSTTVVFNILLAGHARMPIGRQTLAMSFCAIMEMPEQNSKLLRALREWLDFEATDTDQDGTLYYLFTENDGKRRRVDHADEANVARRIQSGGLVMIMAKKDDEGAMIGVMTPALVQSTQAGPRAAPTGR